MSLTKTPLQAVVGVICDCLSDLPADEQSRALEAVRVTLGLLAPRSVQDRNPYRDTITREPLPRVEVQMMNDRPVVVNPAIDRPGQGLVVAGPRRTTIIQPRQIPRPPRPLQPRGYVRALR